MTRSVGYSQCSVLVDTSYPMDARYQQVNLSLVKNEPLDSIDYLQQMNNQSVQQTYQYVQQAQQQISPSALILPPTPPSPSDAQLDQPPISQPTGHHCNPQINQINQTNQINQVINQQIRRQTSPIKGQTNNPQSSAQSNQRNNQITNRITTQITNQMNSQVSSRVNDQINHRPNSQMNSQPTNSIKGSQPYLSIVQSKPQLIQQTVHQPASAVGKYRKKQLHALAKPYHLPSSSGDQLTRSQLKSGNSISRRNERERRRVRNVNNGFQELRKRIPQGEKKMSKVETLRSAVRYIRDLQELLNKPNQISGSSTEFLFSILQQNASSLNALVNSESSNASTSPITASQSQGSQQDSSLVDYFDLSELLASQ